MRKSAPAIFISLLIFCSATAITTLTNPAKLNAQTEVGSETECDSNCVQNAGQAASLCRQYEVAVNNNPNDFNAKRMNTNCQYAFYKWQLCQQQIPYRIQVEGYVDPSVCMIHLSELFESM
jgi:archaellum component FlaG (FlaF/FlaG flagellin family)